MFKATAEIAKIPPKLQLLFRKYPTQKINKALRERDEDCNRAKYKHLKTDAEMKSFYRQAKESKRQRCRCKAESCDPLLLDNTVDESWVNSDKNKFCVKTGKSVEVEQQ